MLKSTLISSAVGIMVFFSVHAHQAPSQTNPLDRSSFVIIAAFNFHHNAKRYTEYIRQNGMNAEYAFNKQRQLYYVYALQSKEDDKAKSLVWKLRENVDFNDAWLFRGRLVDNDGTSEIVKVNPPNTELESTSAKTIATSDPEENNSTAEKSVESASISSDIAINSDTKSDAKVKTSKSETSDVVAKKAVIEEPIIKEQYKLYVNTVNSRKFKEVRGSMEIRDNQRDKKIKVVNSHTLIGLNDPKNGSHTVKIVSRIFGYRPLEHVIDLDQPVNDSTSNYVETIGDSIIVHFDLERLQKGEIAVMWNVYFFKDAAIMRPESRSELNHLLAMLKENENLRIKIHGHTNGSSHGKLLHLNLEDKEFFSLSGNHMEDVGSAKKLSEYRGYAIQHYLIDQGIEETRMEIVGWGGKKMLYDKHDAQARKNVRVEVEILDI